MYAKIYFAARYCQDNRAIFHKPINTKGAIFDSANAIYYCIVGHEFLFPIAYRYFMLTFIVLNVSYGGVNA
ncbi:hypothetical protein KDA_36530 [Dictyobacter alpinus]|uniref:Uncharacterized protein n=1 Tax=Dictyobacter alpinus TaxID=2014873 RepID=A0A402BA47_9CHLR|nr:hypothetical protein KDA_36530 [Dictyobacter alpinus]